MTKEELMKEISKSGIGVLSAPQELKEDKEFILEAIRTRCSVYYYMSYHDFKFIHDEDIILETAKSYELQKNQFDNTYYKKDPDIFQYLQLDHLQSINIEFIQKLMSINIKYFYYALDTIKNNECIIFDFYEKYGETILNYLGYKLKRDINFIINFCKKYDESILKYIDKEMKEEYENYQLSKVLIESQKPEDIDFSIALNTIIIDKQSLSTLPSKFYSNKKIVMSAVKNNAMDLQYASTDLKNDYDIVYKAVSNCGYALEFASDELKNNNIVVKTAVQNHPQSFEYASDRLKNDKSFIIDVLCGETSAMLEYISDNLKTDFDINMIILNRNSSYKYIHEKYRNSRDFIVKAIIKNPFLYKNISNDFKSDIEICCLMLLSKRDSRLFSYLNYDLKNNENIKWCENYYNDHYNNKVKTNTPDIVDNILSNKEYVVDLLVNNVYLYKYIPSNLVLDSDVVNIVIQQRARLIFERTNNIISETLLLEIIKNNVYELSFYSDKLKYFSDLNFVTKAVKINGYSLTYANNKIKNNKDIVLLALENNPNIYDSLNRKFKQDTNIINLMNNKYGRNIVIKQTNESNNILIKNRILKKLEDKFVDTSDIDNDIQRLDNEDFEDKEFMRKLLTVFGEYLEYASDEIQNDKELVMLAVNSCYYAFEYASNELKSDKTFILDCLKNIDMSLYDDCTFIEYIDEALLDNEDFMSEVVKYDKYALENMSNRLKGSFSFARKIFSINKHSLLYFDNEVLNMFDKNELPYYIQLKNQPKLLEDKSFVLNLIKENPQMYEDLRVELSDDYDIVMIALHSGYPPNYLPKKYQAEIRKELQDIDLFKQLMNITIGVIYDYMEYMNPILSKDKSFIIQLLQKDGMLLEYADELFKDDKEIVMLAITSCNAYKDEPLSVLEFVSENLQDDEEIVFRALDISYEALRYTSKRLLKDKCFIMKCIKKYPSLQKDKEFVLECIDKTLKQDDDILNILSNE